ncbi:hypothetical protein ACFFWD_43510 [Bradyrhizobium erythrophlei]|uniref:hypothetical protein n=1 Tax=Bradyrhizobium erythrophlei TaxID=1437360 RepID=UPI0035EB8BFA
MGDLARIQLVGPITLLAAAMAADATAFELAQHPSSNLLWYLNLDVFNMFRKSRAALDLGGTPFALTFLIASPIAVIGFAGIALKKNLCLAISSNLALVFSAFVVYSWLVWGRAGEAKSASLAWITAPSSGTSTMLAILVLTSVASFATSHLLYFLMLRSHAK